MTAHVHGIPSSPWDGVGGWCAGTIIAGRCPSCEPWPDAVEEPPPLTVAEIAALPPVESSAVVAAVEAGLRERDAARGILAPAPGERMVPRGLTDELVEAFETAELIDATFRREEPDSTAATLQTLATLEALDLAERASG